MQYLTKALFILISLFWCVSCATADKSLTSTRAEGVNFKTFRIFIWQTDAGDSINNTSIFDNQILRNRMHRAIERELANRGLKLGDSNRADLNVQLVVRNKGLIATQTRSNNNNYPYNNRYPYNNNGTTTSTPSFLQHREVIVNCYDRNKNLVWTGAIINDYKNAPDLQKNIENDIAKLMGQYPSGK